MLANIPSWCSWQRRTKQLVTEWNYREPHKRKSLNMTMGRRDPKDQPSMASMPSLKSCGGTSISSSSCHPLKLWGSFRDYTHTHTHTHTHSGQRMGIATHIERRRGHRHGRSPIWVQSVSLPLTSNPRFFWNQHKIPHNTNLLKTVDPRPKTTSQYYTHGDPQTPCSQNLSQTQKRKKQKPHSLRNPTRNQKSTTDLRRRPVRGGGTNDIQTLKIPLRSTTRVFLRSRMLSTTRNEYILERNKAKQSKETSSSRLLYATLTTRFPKSVESN